MALAAVVVISYLLGSIPSARLVARRYQVDILLVGDGNPGAVNVRETLGPGPGAVVLAADIGKGVAAALAAALVVDAGHWPIVLAGLAAMLGHDWPLLGRWRGGNGTATAAGVLFVLQPLVAIISATVAVSAYNLGGPRRLTGTSAFIVGFPLAALLGASFEELVGLALIVGAFAFKVALFEGWWGRRTAASAVHVVEANRPDRG